MTQDAWEVRAIRALPPDLSRLVRSCADEGFRFLGRLVADWESGANRFDEDGALLLEVRAGTRLCAIGGLNQDPYRSSSSFARIRRVYVDPGDRSRGVGRQLVEALMLHAEGRFEGVRLRTDTAEAAAFYERLGFVPSEASPDATHVYPFEMGSDV